MPERTPRRVSRSILTLARGMRHAATPAEAMLWRRLRGSQLGFRFRRQQPIGGFIADFYCAEARLIVEVDGDSHDGREPYDEERTAWLRAQGYRVIRFTNVEAREQLDAVVSAIWEACHTGA